VLVLVFAIAAFDLLYQRFAFFKKMRMSLQEVKDENKQSDGNPETKARIRRIGIRRARQRMMAEVPGASVIITNPTHVAVALKYDKEKMAAPVVLAKGYDDVAQRIKAIAAEHHIPMVENIALARALAKEAEIGKAIPVTWYQSVAEILAAVYRLRKGPG
jgi:flagellar biosynthetic protein FlhB